MSAPEMSLVSVGSGDGPDCAITLWVATPSGATRKVHLTDKKALALVRQIVAVLEMRA